MTAFEVKKIVSVLIHPGTGLLVLMLVVLLVTRSRTRFARRLLLFCALALVAMSSPVVSNLVVGTLENQTEILMDLPESTGLVMVLGAGHYYDDSMPPNTVLSPVALARLTEGVRLWKQKPEVSLMLSGAAFGSQISHAEAMYNAAITMGVDESKIILFKDALHTEAEINFAAATLLSLQDANELVSAESSTVNSAGSINPSNPTDSVSAVAEVEPLNNKLVVVSSATHLPRAELLLRRHGIDYSLAPTEYLRVHASWYKLSTFHLLSVDRALHEWVGMLWYYINSSVRSSVSP